MCQWLTPHSLGKQQSKRRLLTPTLVATARCRRTPPTALSATAWTSISPKMLTSLSQVVHVVSFSISSITMATTAMMGKASGRDYSQGLFSHPRNGTTSIDDERSVVALLGRVSCVVGAVCGGVGWKSSGGIERENSFYFPNSVSRMGTEQVDRVACDLLTLGRPWPLPALYNCGVSSSEPFFSSSNNTSYNACLSQEHTPQGRRKGVRLYRARLGRRWLDCRWPPR